MTATETVAAPPEWAADLTRCVLTGDAPLPSAVVGHFDGLCEPANPGGVATVGWTLSAPGGPPLREFHAVLAHGGPRATNNVAEWVAFLTLLRYVLTRPEVRDVRVVGDSLLVVNQTLGVWAVKAEHLLPLYEEGYRLRREFALTLRSVVVGHTLRGGNAAADSLSERAFFEYAKDTDPSLVEKFHAAKRRRQELKAERRKAGFP